MFQAVFRQSDVLTLPIVALVLFALAFVAVTARAIRKGADAGALAALPLEDDERALAPSRHGASHER
jgi:cbb3-type cytochrome oxidase subunit 3